jgi:hypothetical protein
MLDPIRIRGGAMDEMLLGDGGQEAQEIGRRALVLWPRLNARLIRRCHGDLWRIAQLVSRSTSLPVETIVGMLRAPRITVVRISLVEGETWFG